MSEIKVGSICRTNLSQPGGLVRVLSIEPFSAGSSKLHARIEHIEDHPYGYAKGTIGGYMVDDLVLVEENEQVTHQHIPIEVNGVKAIITGDPNMPEATRKALEKLVQRAVEWVNSPDYQPPDDGDGLYTCIRCQDRYTTSASMVCDVCRQQEIIDGRPGGAE